MKIIKPYIITITYCMVALFIMLYSYIMNDYNVINFILLSIITILVTNQ
jgi:hypothetical protein